MAGLTGRTLSGLGVLVLLAGLALAGYFRWQLADGDFSWLVWIDRDLLRAEVAISSGTVAGPELQLSARTPGGALYYILSGLLGLTPDPVGVFWLFVGLELLAVLVTAIAAWRLGGAVPAAIAGVLVATSPMIYADIANFWHIALVYPFAALLTLLWTRVIEFPNSFQFLLIGLLTGIGLQIHPSVALLSGLGLLCFLGLGRTGQTSAIVLTVGLPLLMLLPWLSVDLVGGVPALGRLFGAPYLDQNGLGPHLLVKAFAAGFAVIGGNPDGLIAASVSAETMTAIASARALTVSVWLTALGASLALVSLIDGMVRTLPNDQVALPRASAALILMIPAYLVAMAIVSQALNPRDYAVLVAPMAVLAALGYGGFARMLSGGKDGPSIASSGVQLFAIILVVATAVQRSVTSLPAIADPATRPLAAGVGSANGATYRQKAGLADSLADGFGLTGALAARRLGMVEVVDDGSGALVARPLWEASAMSYILARRNVPAEPPPEGGGAGGDGQDDACVLVARPLEAARTAFAGPVVPIPGLREQARIGTRIERPNYLLVGYETDSGNCLGTAPNRYWPDEDMAPLFSQWASLGESAGTNGERGRVAGDRIYFRGGPDMGFGGILSLRRVGSGRVEGRLSSLHLHRAVAIGGGPETEGYILESAVIGLTNVSTRRGIDLLVSPTGFLDETALSGVYIDRVFTGPEIAAGTYEVRLVGRLTRQRPRLGADGRFTWEAAPSTAVSSAATVPTTAQGVPSEIAPEVPSPPGQDPVGTPDVPASANDQPSSTAGAGAAEGDLSVDIDILIQSNLQL